MLLLICGFVVGLVWGWVAAHRTVAAECEKLGAFFVGKRVFRCVAIERGLSRQDTISGNNRPGGERDSPAATK